MDPLALSAGRLHQQAFAVGVAVDLIVGVLGVEVVAVDASAGRVQLGRRDPRDRRDLQKHSCSAYSVYAAGLRTHNAGLVDPEELRDTEGAHPSDNALSHPMS